MELPQCLSRASALRAAIQKLRNGAFDVIVMNGRMPGGSSAKDLYEWIASNCPGLEKGLLLTFSSATDAQTRTFLQERSVDSLAKPFEVADPISQLRVLSQIDRNAAAKTKENEKKSNAASAGSCNSSSIHTWRNLRT